jgi:large subunit ribosomal protein L24
MSPELVEEYKTHSMQVREGDTVTIMRGNFAGVEGKVMSVDTEKFRLHIEGVTREKTDGTSVSIPIHSSKTMIKKLNLDDKRRKEILERRGTDTHRRESKGSKARAKTEGSEKGRRESHSKEKE